MTDAIEDHVVAYVDGCLEGEALAEFESALTADPKLVDRVTAQRWIKRQIVAAYGAPPESPSKDAELVAEFGLGAKGNVTSIAAQRRQSPATRTRWTLQAGSLAATLVVGIFFGQNLFPTQTSMISQTNGQLVASAELADKLSNELAGDVGPVQIGISFRTAEGLCRTFSIEQSVSGLGCRRKGQWVLPIMTAGPGVEALGSEYRLASGNISPEVMTEVDRRITGSPLTIAEEKQFRDAGWR